MRDWEICDHCKRVVNGVRNPKNTVHNGHYCYNSIDDDDTCSTFMCNFCIRYYFDNKYEVCHFCNLPIDQVE